MPMSKSKYDLAQHKFMVKIQFLILIAKGQSHQKVMNGGDTQSHDDPNMESQCQSKKKLQAGHESADRSTDTDRQTE